MLFKAGSLEKMVPSIKTRITGGVAGLHWEMRNLI